MRKKASLIAISILVVLGLSACGAGSLVLSNASEEMVSDPLPSMEGRQIRMTSGDVEVLITLNNSQAAADFDATSSLWPPYPVK